MIHLHTHSMYSLLDGYGSPEQYIERAKEIGFSSIAVTDHGSVDGTLKWQQTCKKNNIKPLLGAELYIVPDLNIKQKEKRGHITALVKNAEGWKNLLNMITISNMEGFYSRPRIDYQTLLNHLNGLIIMTACSNSFLKLQGGEEFFYKLVDTIPNSLFLEVMPHAYQDQYDINKLCIDLSSKTTIPLVATNDCHYVLRDQCKTQEVLLAIQRKAKWNDPNRWKFGIEGLHLKDDREMSIGFKRQKILSERQILLAMNNTEKIAEMIDFEIPKLDIELPLTKYEKGGNEKPEEILDHFCKSTFFEGAMKCKWDDEYEKRYQYELKVITEKNFARYFLIVYELLEFCRTKEIFYGPGRGSAAGSLICYLLGITQVDPLKWGTLFERFINPERLDFPDIDLDFDKNKTDLIKKHLEEEYGQYNIATINTFGKLEARAVIRDIGRVFELNTNDVDEYAKSIKDDIKASFDTPEERTFSSKYPEEFKLIQELEGTVKNNGQHAAGLIVSSEDLRTSSRCSLRMAEENAVINWDMGDSEYVGLMKIDVLKLGTLTILDEAKRLMQQNYGKFLYRHNTSNSYFLGKEWEEGDGNLDYLGEFEFSNLDFEDPNIFAYLSKGETAGIFQLTGYDCTKFCKEIKIENMEDVAAVVSIARPGPKKTIANDYVLRKNGMKWTPVHSVYEEITKETYGVMVYQEQLMKAMIYLAGFSGADADKIRKIIGKKRDAKEFEPFREAFLKGCKDKKTLNEKQADEFWQDLLHHANYSFNRSHAISYSIIAYWTAWTKYYFPAEYTCAYLTYGGDTDAALRDKSHLIENIQSKGMNIVTPKIGISDPIKWVAKNNNLYMPFVEIKGIGEKEAVKCATMASPKAPKKGFFGVQKAVTQSSSQNILNEIKAFDPDIFARPDKPEDYFSIKIGKIGNTIQDLPVEEKPKERKRFQEKPIDEPKISEPRKYERVLPKSPKIEIVKKNAIFDRKVLDCCLCDLRKESYQVVESSIGIYNVFIIGEGPGKNEDEEGKGFVGDAGNLLWNELKKYNITRRMVHVGNCCKCYPSVSKTPSEEQIDLCFWTWMEKEIKSMDCKLILALGASAYYALTGEKAGITKISGTMQWIEQLNANVVFCVHPSYVLRSRSDENVKKFEEGIKFFSEKFNENV